MSRLKYVLRDAQHEITRLRQTNAILAAKVEVMDLFACVLHTKPAERTEGASIDVAWELGKEIDAIEKAESASPPPTAPDEF